MKILKRYSIHGYFWNLVVQITDYKNIENWQIFEKYIIWIKKRSIFYILNFSFHEGFIDTRIKTHLTIYFHISLFLIKMHFKSYANKFQAEYNFASVKWFQKYFTWLKVLFSKMRYSWPNLLAILLYVNIFLVWDAWVKVQL